MTLTIGLIRTYFIAYHGVSVSQKLTDWVRTGSI